MIFPLLQQLVEPNSCGMVLAVLLVVGFLSPSGNELAPVCCFSANNFAFNSRLRCLLLQTPFVYVLSLASIS